MNAVVARRDGRAAVRVVLGRCGHHGAARRRTLNRPPRAHRTGSCPRTGTGEVIDGGRSCSAAGVQRLLRHARPGRASIDSRLPTRRPPATDVSTKGGSRGTTKVPMTHFAHRTNSRRLETAMAIFSWYDLSWKEQRDVVRPADGG